MPPLPKLMEHQVTALAKMKNGTVLTGGVGTGKTITSLFYFFEKVMGGTVGDWGSVKVPMDIFVFTTARKRDDFDWQRTAMQFGISTHREDSVNGIKLVVESYNNIQKYVDIQGAFIILDEQRMVGSGAWTKAFLKMAKVNRWIMLSATPGDTWEDYIPLFVANGFYKNRTEFKRRHCVYSYYGRYPKLERYLETGILAKYKNQILIEMPYERHTTRHIHTVPVDYDKDLFERAVKQRWHVYEDRPLNDVSELFSVMRKIVNSDTSRLTAVENLLRQHPRLIVFYNFDYELEQLRTLATSIGNDSNVSTDPGSRTKSDIPTDVDQTHQIMSSTPIRSEKSSKSQRSPVSQLGTNTHPSTMDITEETGITSNFSVMPFESIQVAEYNGHKHQDVPEGDRWVYLVQYMSGSEAWNCTATDAMAFYSLTYSYKMFEQSQGRIDRLNTPYTHLHYYVLASKSPVDRAVSRSLKEKKDFNEKDFGMYVK